MMVASLIPAFGTLASSFSAFIGLYFAFALVSLFRNVRAAKATGITYTIAPYVRPKRNLKNQYLMPQTQCPHLQQTLARTTETTSAHSQPSTKMDDRELASVSVTPLV